VTETTAEHPPAPAPKPPEGELASGPLRLGLTIAAVVTFGVYAGANWLIIIAAIIVMIFLHELGHYLTAKWAGMKVTEFFIGFGPRIWSFRRGETEYGLKAIPAGAYVRIIGMNNLDEVDPADERRTYRQKSFPRRMSVAVAGSTMHFLQALVCLVIVLAFTGAPSGTIFGTHPEDGGPRWIVASVTKGSAAQKAGLEPGDRIVGYDGDTIERFGDIKTHVRDDLGRTVTLEIVRDGEPLTLEATIGPRPKSAGGEAGSAFLGIGPSEPFETKPLPQAVGASVVELGQGLRTAVGALGGFFTGGLGDYAGQVADGGNPTPSATTPAPGGTSESPPPEGENRLLSIYGVARLGADALSFGMANLFLILIQINIFVGVFNLIPLPPFDGGHVALGVYERIRSRKGRRYMADMSRVLPVAYAVVMFMVLLGISSLYLDIVNPIGS
jgi:membrane-associated protease RseP (regulator of RpoE activity)